MTIADTSKDNDVVRMTHAGKSINEIARHLGILPRQVSRIRKRNNIQKQGYPRKLSDDELARCKRLLEEGLGYTETAKMTGHCPVTLSKHFPGMGMSTSEGCMKGRINTKVKEMLHA